MYVINFLPVLQPLAIILGLITVYISLSRGADIFTAVFRGVVVYAVFILMGMIFNYFYLLTINRMQQKEKEKAQEEARKRAEEESRKPVEGENA